MINLNFNYVHFFFAEHTQERKKKRINNNIKMATTPTINTTNSHHRIYRNTNNFILFANFILFCTVPLISCKSDGKGNGVDAGELRKQLISSHNIEHSNSEWKSEKAENEGK